MGATSATATQLDAAPSEPTLGALVASASRDVSTLVHDEIDLFKTEIKSDVAHAVKGSGMFVVAGVIAVLASIVLSFALAYGLFALGLSRWLSFLIVGVVYLLVAGLLAFLGLRQVKKVKPPERTIGTTKDTVAVLKGAAKPAKH